MYKYFIFLLFIEGTLHGQDLKMSSIDTLNAVSSHTEFLTVLSHSGEVFRSMTDQVIQDYGQDSEVYQRLAQSIRQQDSLNVMTTDYYLAKHGYPDPKTYGEAIAVIPFQTIQQGATAREHITFYPYVFDAYQLGFITSTQYTAYLDRSYVLQTGKAFTCSDCDDQKRLELLEESVAGYRE